jgi:hypothetical protein
MFRSIYTSLSVVQGGLSVEFLDDLILLQVVCHMQKKASECLQYTGYIRDICLSVRCPGSPRGDGVIHLDRHPAGFVPPVGPALQYNIKKKWQNVCVKS